MGQSGTFVRGTRQFVVGRNLSGLGAPVICSSGKESWIISELHTHKNWTKQLLKMCIKGLVKYMSLYINIGTYNIIIA